MYLCADCEEVFEEPSTYTERHGLDTPPYETIQCCPYCGSDDYSGDVNQCVNCDEWFTPDELEGGWCDDCAKGEFSIETGLAFLKAMKLEEDFFLDELWRKPYRIPRYDPDHAKPCELEIDTRLAMVLKDRFLLEVTSDEPFNDGHSYIAALRDFCLCSNSDLWVEYLNGGRDYSREYTIEDSAGLDGCVAVNRHD